METINYMQVVPHSAFTIGDLIEAEIQNKDGTWEVRKGRITNDWQNNWQFALIEENVDDEGKPWQACHCLFNLDDEKSIKYRNPKVIEQGPWHRLLCGDL